MKLSRRFLLPVLLSTQAAFADSPVVGQIGDIQVKSDELREAIAGFEAAQQTPADPAALSQYVRALLIQRLVLKEAVDRQWDQKPEVIAQLVRAREAALTESYLQSVSTPDAAFPDEAQLTAAYETAKPALLVPKTYRVAQIFIAAPKDAEAAVTDKARARFEAARKQLAAKEADFAAIARTVSEEPESAARGGEIGWLQENQIQPEIAKLLPTLKTGQVSEPVRLDDGWHFLKLLDSREPRTPALDEVRAPLAARLRAEKAHLNREEYLAELIRKHPLAINEIELSKALPRPLE